MSVVSYEIKGTVGIIRLNNPPVNALSYALREGIIDALNAAQHDESKAIIIYCEGRTFIAGADITEFGKPPKEPTTSMVVAAIENSSKPTVAAIHGTALGGGFEVALACHYRCALATAKVGLPEVKLGILPGAGGTQRAPRLAGVEAALELITSGNPISASKAQGLNLIDRVVDGDLMSAAIAYAEELIDSNAALKRVGDIVIDPATAPRELFDKWRKKIAKKARGQISPLHIISCVEAAVHMPLAEGLAKEREYFTECVQSEQSAAMRHLFFAERLSAKVKDLPKDTPIRDVKTVGVIGGGTMGGGIAMNFANVGIPVKILEINDEALQRGMDLVRKNYSITVSKGKLSQEGMDQCLALITGTTSYDDLSDLDLIIEAVFESIDLKKEVFAKLDAVCKPGAILATNTSYQDVNIIAEATKRPEDVVGMHFFSPANVMKLLEVVRCEKTSDEVINTTMKLAKTINKIPALARVCYGFIGNRMFRNYISETQRCLIGGSSPEQIDSVMQEWGMAMGPLSVNDLSGIDISYTARKTQTAEQKGEPASYCIPDALVEMGRMGQKTGAGYYRYDPETRAKTTDPLTMQVIEELAEKHQITRRPISNEEISDRLIFALVNEGANILSEGIAQRPSDIDVVFAYGYAFPVFRGGPMHYADTVGLSKVYDSICRYRDMYGESIWTPAPLLEQLAREGKTFKQWAEEQE